MERVDGEDRTHAMDAAETTALLDRVRGTAQELSRTSAEVDRGRIAPHRGYRLIREAGLLKLLVPRQFGGAGLSFLDYTKVLETLAVGDAATAIGFHTHNVAIGSLCETGGSELPVAADRFRSWLFAQVVESDAMFASATSETGSGTRLRDIRVTYRRSGDGYALKGTKSAVSPAGIADHYVVAARAEGSVISDRVSHFVVSKDDHGVAFSDPGNAPALRGTWTATMTMSDVPVPRHRLFLGAEGLSLFRLVREPHWAVSGCLGAHLGIAESILRSMVRLLRDDELRRSSSAIQADVGRLAVDLRAARSLVYSAARLVDEEKGTLEADTAVHAAKYCVGELAPRLALAAVRICGPDALRRPSPLERLLREAAFCSTLPAGPEECLRYVGRSTLGFHMGDAENSDW
ncbi:acyl-CoA dehydrogenase family protein [Streptomyces sp. NPDC058308]|uniref:acyl-CoA dehydrogenase family protein n=1 Tax=Streptomyces sp. NPDC058308 TaxID=3346440 RepID=UPI0036EEBE23